MIIYYLFNYFILYLNYELKTRTNFKNNISPLLILMRLIDVHQDSINIKINRNWICIQKIIRLVLFQCEPSDYEEVVNLLFEVLYTAEITKERLLVFIQRLLNDVAQV